MRFTCIERGTESTARSEWNLGKVMCKSSTPSPSFKLIVSVAGSILKWMKLVGGEVLGLLVFQLYQVSKCYPDNCMLELHTDRCIGLNVHMHCEHLLSFYVYFHGIERVLHHHSLLYQTLSIITLKWTYICGNRNVRGTVLPLFDSLCLSVYLSLMYRTFCNISVISSVCSSLPCEVRNNTRKGTHQREKR